MSVHRRSLAPAGGKPPDNPFDERSAGKRGGGRSGDRGPAQRANEEAARRDGQADAPAHDEPITSDAEEPGDDSAGQRTKTRKRKGACTASPAWKADATGGRRKGVQRRDFLKRHRFEVARLGGYYASDALSSTYSYGGAVAFYPSEDFGLELLVTRTPVKFRLEEPFSAFDKQDALPARRRLAGHRLAALVADSRQVQVHRRDDHPRRSLRHRRRGSDVSRNASWA